jgi:hypothetical protein
VRLDLKRHCRINATKLISLLDPLTRRESCGRKEMSVPAITATPNAKSPSETGPGKSEMRLMSVV